MQANLSQVFVACASQVGDTGHADLLGSSILVDPRGHSLIGPLGDTEETAAADIDPSAADRAQQRGSGINPRQNRRTDVYRLWMEGEELTSPVSCDRTQILGVGFWASSWVVR